MKCVDSTEVMRLFAGQLSVERAELLNVHFQRCASCAAVRDELGTMTARMRHETYEFEDPEAVDEVMALIRTGKADRAELAPARPSFWKSWQTWLVIPATAAATAMVMLMFWPAHIRQADDGFQARGSSAVDLDRFVSLQIFRATDGGYEPVQDGVATDDALAFSYLNRPENALHYLALFGVDAEGKVFWYYPPSDKVDDGSRSIAIQATEEPIELPEQVVHDLTPGPLRIFGVFSPEPLPLNIIEQQLQRDLASGRSVEQLRRLGLSGVGQHSLLLHVQEARPKDTR